MSITQNQIRDSYISLIAVTSSAPSSFALGDSYYNTSTNLIYTAISDTEGGAPYWGEGEAPIENHLYCDINANVFYGVESGVLFANIGTGQITNPLSSDLDANNHKISNLPNAEDPQDAVTKSQLDTKANITDVILSSEKGVANGIAELDANAMVSISQLPIATLQNTGMVKPDGVTTNVDSSGVISAVQPDVYRPPLLSFIWSDHIINQVSWLRGDTFSWQSGSVYVSAYNELVSEYTNNAAVPKTDITSTNYIKVGSPNIENGIVSNLSTSNYVKTNISLNFNEATSWEIVTKHNFSYVGSINDGLMGVLGGPYNVNYYITSANKLCVELSSNGSSYNIGSLSTLNAIVLNEDFYIKTEFTGSAYNLYYGTDLENLTLQATISDSTKVSSRSSNFAFGVDESGSHTSWLGSIDLENSYIKIDNNVVWTWADSISYKLTPKGYKIVDPSKESDILKTFTNTGVAWYYILDTENTRFKLPRTKFGFTGLRTNVGDFVELGLPNILGSLDGIGTSTSYSFGAATGCVTKSAEYSGMQTGNSGYMKRTNMGIDASLSSNIYGNSETVQPPATQMYLYFYVGNFTEQAIEQTAGLNTNLFNNKVDLDLSNVSTTSTILNNIFPSGMDYVIEYQAPVSSNNYTWYRKYRSGWVEQGGVVDNGVATHTWNKQITFLKPMADAAYFISVNALSNNPTQCGADSMSETGMTIYSTRDGGSAITQYMIWKIEGQGAL